MAYAQGDRVDDNPPVRDACEKCVVAMKLMHIVPDEAGYEIRTWRCAACGEEKIDRVTIG